MHSHCLVVLAMAGGCFAVAMEEDKNPVVHKVNNLALAVRKRAVELRVPMGGEVICRQRVDRLEARWVRVFS